MAWGPQYLEGPEIRSDFLCNELSVYESARDSQTKTTDASHGMKLLSSIYSEIVILRAFILIVQT